MPKSRSLAIAAALASITFTFAANAQDGSLGEIEFMNSCAQCHGAGGKGDGVMAGFLNTAAPDLTVLQQANGGVFPFARVYGVIDGTVQVGAHGTTEMPAWGQRYAAKTPAALGWEYSQQDQEAFVRGRILALTEYISTLQQQ
ncbi:c-type cytochrome [Ostreiculturibacter nitratireducens]|uniref:c-type cytochrome n=1 Tax=Ostreiculturibacter nitratireducens TaxID=3075226 RepID=UPI0031B5A760